MKQNSQWLSQVRTLSNNAECTSTPSGSPARLSTSTSVSRPPRRTSTASTASSTNCRHSSRSRGTSPLTDRISSPSTRPTRAAGEPGATATTRGADIDVGVYGFGGPTRRFAPRVGARRPRRYAGPMPVDKVLLAAPRGFCAGVEMAIKALAWMVRAFEPPVYCYHEIVHNQLVVDRFRDLGVVFVDDVHEVPEGRPIMLSAHGSAPEVVAAAKAKGSYVVNAVCPLVTKVHHEVKVRAGKGYRIVYVGHEGHEEAVGTMAVAPDAIDRVESIAEVDALPDRGEQPVALLAQTTLSHRDWAAVADRAAEVPTDLAGTVGVTAGASAPEELVDAVIARLAPVEGVEEVTVTEEDEYFPPPRELRDLLAGVDVLATFGLGGSVPDRPAADDRTLP